MDESTLIQHIKAGNTNALKILLENNKNLIWHIIISMVGRNSDSEDIFQEVCLKMIKGIKRFKGESKLSTWVGSLTYYACSDYLRKKVKLNNIYGEESEEVLMKLISGEDNNAQLEGEEISNLIKKSIKKLPPSFRTVITLYHLDEQSYGEIAIITGMPEGTVKSYINRGRSILRKNLENLLPDIREYLYNI